MKLKSGYVYNVKKEGFNGYINERNMIYIGCNYDGDITGFGDYIYKFINYSENMKDKIDIEDIIEYKISCSDNFEDIVGKISLIENIIPFNIKYVKKTIEYYNVTRKKEKIIYE